MDRDGEHRMDEDLEQSQERERRQVLARIRTTALVAWILLIPIVGFWRGWWAILGLTCSASVVMINFLWLEEIVRETLQPAPRVRAWRVVVRVFLRFALLGLALAITIVIARFETISVILGFSIIVIGIMGEAAHSLVKSLRSSGVEN